MVVADTGVGFVAAGKVELVDYTVVGRRCNWQEELHTALGVGHIPVKQLAVATTYVSPCQTISTGRRTNAPGL